MANTDDIKKILAQHFHAPITKIEEINAGNINKIFSFSHDEKYYILRLNKNKTAFQKAGTLSKILTGGGVPFAKIHHIGEHEEDAYSISQKIAGNPIGNVMSTEKLAISIIKNTQKIHQTPLVSTLGYGFLADNGDGIYSNWNDFIDAFFSEVGIGTFWTGWYELFETSCLERDVFDEIFARLKKYSQYNAPYRHLVHGDLHGLNILAQGDEVTGIIDFDNVMYGDFLIDIATIDLVVEAKKFEAHYKKIGMPIENFNERYLGAKYFKGLDNLRFYAKMGNVASYESLRDYLLDLEG